MRSCRKIRFFREWNFDNLIRQEDMEMQTFHQVRLTKYPVTLKIVLLIPNWLDQDHPTIEAIEKWVLREVVACYDGESIACPLCRIPDRITACAKWIDNCPYPCAYPWKMAKIGLLICKCGTVRQPYRLRPHSPDYFMSGTSTGYGGGGE